jgi:Rod binding domain-containing protein
MVLDVTQSVAPALAEQGEPGVPSSAAQAPANKAGMAKLQKAAQDFEAIMINSLWGSMKDGSLGSDDDLDDPANGSLEQLGMQMVSGALAQAGGLGIGRMIVHALGSKV